MFEHIDRLALDEQYCLYHGTLPAELVVTGADFDALWAMHPAEHHEIHIHGRRVATPRWQQAYGADYHFSGQVYEALPTPDSLTQLHDWARATIFERLNGILVNWYDGALGHYVGKHRDSIVRMVPDAPIVTVSFGEERRFRLRPYGKSGFLDFPARSGSVFVLPFDTNRAWTHEVPASRKLTGRRISVTFRAFQP